MTQTDLSSIKKELKVLYKAINPTLDYFNSPVYEVVSVLLQNMQFDASNCADYSFQKELKQYNDAYNAFEHIVKYENIHILYYIKERIDQIVFAVDYNFD